MNRKIKISRLLTMAVILIMTFTMTTLNLSAWTVAENVIVLEGQTLLDKYTAFRSWWNNFEKAKFKTEYSDGNVDVVLDNTKAEFDDVNNVIFLKKPANWNNGSGSVDNIGTITFKNAGIIGNRSVDVIIEMKNISLSTDNATGEYPSSGLAQIAFFRNSSGNLWFGGYPLNPVDESNILHGPQIIDIASRIEYSGTDDTVDLSVIHLIKDLDMNGKEGVQTLSGYNGSYYRFENAIWTLDTADNQLNITSKVTDKSDEKMLGGEAEYLLGGVFLETEGGEFSSRLRTCDSGITYMIYSQYLNISNSMNPYKEIVNEKSEPYKKDELVIFNVAHTMFNWNETFSEYSEMSIYDDIPDGLVYDSAKVLDGNGNDITATAGTLSNAGKRVTFKFNDSWLNTKANYNGKDITLQITAKVDGTKLGTIVNVGHVVINGIDMATNEVDVEVIGTPVVTTEETTTTPETTAPETTEAESTAPETTTTPEPTPPGFVVYTSTPQPGTPPTKPIDLGAGVIEPERASNENNPTVYVMVFSAVISVCATAVISVKRKRGSKNS